MLKVVDLLEVWRGAGAGGLWTPDPGAGARVSQWRFPTRALPKTARTKQGSATYCQPLLTTTRAQCRDLLKALQD